MKKLKQELNANSVGAAISHPHFEEMTQNKGITLIALIITIIVMLILVGVTINIALNGGLFTRASEAAMETEKRAILEQIIALAEWENNGKINVKATVDNVKQEFGEDKVVTNPSTVTESTTEVIVTITGKHGTYNYKITTEKIVIETDGTGGTDGDVVNNDFEIELSQREETGGKSYVQSVVLYMNPIIPKSWAPEYTEDEAATIVAKNLLGASTTVTNLEQLELQIYNTYINMDVENNPLYGLEAATDFDDLSNKLSSKIGKESPSKKDIETYLLQALGAPYATVQEAAADLYEYKAETKKLKINGKETTEGVSWDDNSASYEIKLNGTYEIELELDGKIGRTTVEITGISYLGKYVKYDSDGDNDLTDEILYRVLYNDGELGQGQGAQIIANDVLELNVDIGSIDDTIPEGAVTEDLDGDGYLYLERAIYSYNKAVQTLNKKCEDLVTLRPGITTGARCVGSDPLDPDEEKSSIQYVEADSNWYNGLIRKGLDLYADVPEEKQRLQDIGILQSTNIYWFATRGSHFVFDGSFNFGLYTSGLESYDSTCEFVISQSYYVGSDMSITSGLRPVVMLEYGVLLNADTGMGTENSPIVLQPVS